MLVDGALDGGQLVVARRAEVDARNAGAELRRQRLHEHRGPRCLARGVFVCGSVLVCGSVFVSGFVLVFELRAKCRSTNGRKGRNQINKSTPGHGA